MAEPIGNSPETRKQSARFTLPLLGVALVAMVAAGWLAGQRFLVPGRD